MSEHDTIQAPPDDEITATDHDVPSAPPVFDPSKTEAPPLLVEAIDRLTEVSRVVTEAGKAVEGKQDELGRGIDAFTRVVGELVEQVTELKLSVAHTSNTMDAALSEMRQANQRVTAVEEDVRRLKDRVAAVERWQREHRCNGSAT